MRHGFKCTTKNILQNKKCKCNCKIGKLARNIYFWCYRRDISADIKIIDKLANSLITFYKEDKSPRHYEFFGFLKMKLLGTLKK